MKKDNKSLTRRELLRRIVTGAGGALAAGSLLGACDRLSGASRALAGSAAATGAPRKFLIVVGATGGASIIDSFLAIRETESANAASINCFPDALVTDIAGSPFRAVDQDITSIGPIPVPNGTVEAHQSSFVTKHKDDMLVATLTASSVNHAVAQMRAVTGGGAWNGRTLQEIIAMEYGGGLALPNVSMSNVGYSQRGADEQLPAEAYGVAVANPLLWPLGLHGSRGLPGVPDADLVDLARAARAQIDQSSNFLHTFAKSETLTRWLTQTSQGGLFEQTDLITKLNFLPDSAEFPLSQYGLQPSPDGQAVRDAFPHYDSDPVEAQAALAFLLLKTGVSNTVTLAPTFDLKLEDNFTLQDLQGQPIEEILFNPPLAFDLSHTELRTSQAFMWKRTLGIVDRLIDLLAAEEHPEAPGESLWDHAMIYVATDFGRDKGRPSGATSWGAGHELNNGVLIVSPMARGNTILGGVDPDTGYTYGFDPVTGAADPGRTMLEKEIFAGILQIFGVDTAAAGLPDVPAMR